MKISNELQRVMQLDFAGRMNALMQDAITYHPELCDGNRRMEIQRMKDRGKFLSEDASMRLKHNPNLMSELENLKEKERER